MYGCFAIMDLGYMWVLRTEPDPLQKQQVFLTAEPSLCFLNLLNSLLETKAPSKLNAQWSLPKEI